MKYRIKLNTRMITTLALLVALEVVLSRMFSIRTPVVTVGFGFVPLVLAGTLYGPVAGALVAGVADIIGAVLLPIGPYFPGFTLTAVLSGTVYGLLLHKKSGFRWDLLAAATVLLLLDLGLNTYWLTIVLGKGYLALVPVRLLKCAILLPIQTSTIALLDNLLVPLVRPRLASK